MGQNRFQHRPRFFRPLANHFLQAGDLFLCMEPLNLSYKSDFLAQRFYCFRKFLISSGTGDDFFEDLNGGFGASFSIGFSDLFPKISPEVGVLSHEAGRGKTEK